MRINLIGNFNPNTGVSQDVSILHGLIVHVLGPETRVRRVPHFHPQCPQAEINFFIEVVNPCLFNYAGYNIWIPNPEWTYQTWIPYLHMVDEVWAKTEEGLELFKAAGAKRVLNVGWTSIDKGFAPKDWSKAVVPVGKNVWRDPKPIVQAYMRLKNDPVYSRLPALTIVSRLEMPVIPEQVTDKITRIEFLPEDEYKKLVQEAGLVVCTSAAEGFGHAVNEGMSTGSLMILSPIAPFRELTKEALWVSTSKSMKHPQCLGTLEDVEIDSIVDSLKMYCDMSVPQREAQSRRMREAYEDRHEAFIARMTGELKNLAKILPYSMEARLPEESDLPSVSVITLTRDRRAFIPLAKYCMVAQTYPESKIEWVIVDDGKDQIKDLVSDLPNVTYVLVDEPMTIGAKRNLGISRAKHDVLIMMDDDDVYPNNSILTRVAHLFMEPAAGCLFSTVLPSYDIHETKSFMNVPPITLPMAQRVSEATICCTRKFWEDKPFPDQQIAEGDAFISGREQMCREISPQDVIVSLTHRKTTSSRKAPAGEPNGCHYGFSDDLFTLVSEIAARLT
uniref:Uncharacterized protein n=1 Tax=viral metagenome TaxID=1070528 RepID=A0A6C0M0E2_9ZZZZ